MADAKTTLGDLKIEIWDVNRPIDSENNNKLHTTESVAKLAKSISSLGQIQPIVVDMNGVIIAGHGRRRAIRELGQSTIKVIQVNVTEEQARRMRLADNLTVNDKMDMDAIGRELTALAQSLDLSQLTDSIGMTEQQLNMVAPDLAGVFDTINSDAISTDLKSDVETFSKEGEELTEKLEDELVRIKDIFGFDKVTARQGRTLRRFIGLVMDETKVKDPAAALAQWSEELMA